VHIAPLGMLANPWHGAANILGQLSVDPLALGARNLVASA